MAHRTYTRHGLHALKARVMVRGLQALDGRTVAAQHLVAFRRELLDDLGGESAVSAAQLALVEVATRTRLYLDHVDAVLLERESLVIRRTRLLPLVEQRGRLADSPPLARLLGQLGLERRQRPPPSLAEYVAEKYGGHEPPHDPPQEEPEHDHGDEPRRDEDPGPGGPGAAAPGPGLWEGGRPGAPLMPSPAGQPLHVCLLDKCPLGRDHR